MKIRFEKLPISAVMPDESFRIGYGSPTPELEASIIRVGIINPVWVRPAPESGEQFQLVLGYSRFHAARSNDISPLPCLVIEEEISDQDLLLANIYDNLSQREFNPVEKALALEKSMRLLGISRTTLEIMPALQLASSEDILENTIRILDMEEPILSAIAKGGIPPSNAFALLNLEKDEQVAVFLVFRDLKLGVNLQREFMENLFECSRKQGISVKDLLESENLKTILSDKKKPERDRAETMRKELRRMRYPRLAEMEASFNECIRSMKPSPQVQILPPPWFETQDFGIQVRFRTPGDLLNHLDKIGAAFRSPEVLGWFQNHSSQKKLKSD